MLLCVVGWSHCWLIVATLPWSHHARSLTRSTERIGRARENRVIGVGFDMFFQVLRTLERLSTEVALVGFEWHMDSDVRGDVVAFDGGCVALSPCTGQIQVVGGFAADMTLAHMLLTIVSIDCERAMRLMRRKNGLHIELRVTRIAHRSPATGTAGSRHEHSRDHRCCPRSVAEPESDLSHLEAEQSCPL